MRVNVYGLTAMKPRSGEVIHPLPTLPHYARSCGVNDNHAVPRLRYRFNISTENFTFFQLFLAQISHFSDCFQSKFHIFFQMLLQGQGKIWLLNSLELSWKHANLYELLEMQPRSGEVIVNRHDRRECPEMVIINLGVAERWCYK